MIYLDALTSYPIWALILVFVGILMLVYGVFLLSHVNEEVPSSDIDDENSIHGDDDDKLSGFSSWSGDSLFNKKPYPAITGRNKWTGGGVKGLFKKNSESNIQGEKGGVKGEFRKFGMKEEKIKNKLVTENVNEKKTMTENVEKGGLAV
ncbi:3511_t:CDS:2 [Funneliformis geosporum]|uniref:3511_t:CDS:1 n=1 Tax=Funneliformis geosporum TaxID=1117311 RepID=A0A9W4WJA1_9GLOM|nr:3511_t:CDS:2 [Funneliformis geosporum]